MSNLELAARARKALEKFRKLPTSMQLEILVKEGVIDRTGQPIWSHTPQTPSAQQD